MRKRELVVLSAYTGVLMCRFDELHAYLEEILGRPVWAHELAWEEVTDEIKQKSRAEFLEIISRVEE